MSTIKQIRKRTTMQSLVRIGVFCSANSAELNGKTFRQIAARIRQEFSGDVITDKAILQTLQAANITVMRRAKSKVYRDRTGRVARALLNVITNIEREFGIKAEQLLSKEDRLLLSHIICHKTKGEHGEEIN